MTFMYDIIYICQHGGIGRRTGLKIQRWQHRAGSTPAAGIIIKTRFFKPCLFIFSSNFPSQSYLKLLKNIFLIISQEII